MPARYGDRWDRLAHTMLPINPVIGTTRSLGLHTIYMKAVIRRRQNVEADFLDELGIAYDWNNELSKKMLPRRYKVDVGAGIRWMKDNLEKPEAGSTMQ